VAEPADVENSFAVTQATWRFFAKERVTPQTLVAPLRGFAREQLACTAPGTIENGATPALPYVLAVVDWSKIDDKRSPLKISKNFLK